MLDPSLYINPDKNVWLCRSCNRGGGLIELACYAWGYDPKDGHDRAIAAANVLMTFGHPLPERPRSWFRRQQRQRMGRGRALQDLYADSLAERPTS